MFVMLRQKRAALFSDFIISPAGEGAAARGGPLRRGRTEGFLSQPSVSTRSPRVRSTHRANNGFRARGEKV